MAAEKVLHKRGMLTDILHMASKNCGELTNGYQDCRPPFRYKNSATGEVRECFKACYEHSAEWLRPLLQNIPSKVHANYGMVGSSRTIGISVPAEPYFLVRYAHKSNKRVSVRLSVLDNREDSRENMMKRYRDPENAFFPESVAATTKHVQTLLNKFPNGGTLDVQLPETTTSLRQPPRYKHDDDDGGGSDVEEEPDILPLGLSFPGNDAWNHFAKFTHTTGPNGIVLKLNLHP